MTLQRQNGGSKPPPYDGDGDAREIAKRRAEALPKEKAKKRDAEGVIPYKETGEGLGREIKRRLLNGKFAGVRYT